MKYNLLFVGEHPASPTGNSHMLAAILKDVDKSKYDITLFVANELPPWDFAVDYPIIPAADYANNDHWGMKKLLDLVSHKKFDGVVFVGVDAWRYVPIFGSLIEIRDRTKLKFTAIFPFDLQEVRDDWISWINFFNFPCVYSEYGYNKLSSRVTALRYFRPPLHMADIYRPFTQDEKITHRMNRFPNARDKFIFGFIGQNQIRKDPQKLIKAFKLLLDRINRGYAGKNILKETDVALYLHTDLQMVAGGYNLHQYMLDLELKTGSVLTKTSEMKTENMPVVFNCLDCLVNCTMQEGLSWTPLEAMLCGVPVIASDTTAHPELIKNAGILVPIKEDSFIPLVGRLGPTYIEAKSCKAEDIADAMFSVLIDDKLRKSLSESGIKKAKRWLNGVSNINDLLQDITSPPKSRITTNAKSQPKKDAILFIQHSAAGDILMTTKCFKGLKERHDGKPLFYMTQEKYKDILIGNPYVEGVLEWKDSIPKDFSIVYNPHGDKILPGHWGRNSNSILSDFYWRILKVPKGDFFIGKVKPNDAIMEILTKNHVCPELLSPDLHGPICIVHTTGGDPEFRTYQYMKDVCEGLRGRYLTIQVGNTNDYPAGADWDFRGKLSFRQTAWVMSRASMAVTVDSFVSHLAGALGVSQVCLFGSGNAYVVRPDQVKGILICLVPNYINDCKGLGPCSASVRDCPATCTGVHDPKMILKAIKEIEIEGGNNASGLHHFQYAQ